MKEHASIVKLQLTLDPSSGNAKFIADGMHLSPEEISTQLSLSYQHKCQQGSNRIRQ
jgi:hypothetical protein